jgi:serine/threonine protein kinase
MGPTARPAAPQERRIGRYRITGRIGRGGMGIVYRGLDEVLEREVAIKTLTVEGTLDEESRKRFDIEAKAAAKLQHPNIVTVFELGEERGMPFIAMELLPGVDLEVLLRSGEPFLLQEKLDVVIQVLRGLAFAHEHGIVHRDMKPSNIRILDDGTVKIMDFGIAKLGGTSVTKSGMMVGTVHYMSPEQIRGRGLDGRSDVFSVGVILHELLSGERPFTADAPTAVLYKIIHERPAPLPLGELGEVGPRLQEITRRALEKEPEARHPGASALADELATVLARYTRSLETTVSSQDLETLNQARRLFKEGRVEDSQKRLRDVVTRIPYSVEARRALRTASRELQRLTGPREAEAQDFPELDSPLQTFQALETQRAPDTLLQPTVLDAPEGTAGPARERGTGLVLGLLVVAALALGAAAYLLWGRAAPAPGASPRIAVRSRPPGAFVLVDGRDTGLLTDAELVLPASGPVTVTLRKEGYRDAARALTLPVRAGDEVSLDLVPLQARLPVSSDPGGAAVSLDGVRLAGATPLEVTLDPGVEHRLAISLEGHRPKDVALLPGKLPAEVRVTLEPAGPLGTVTVASAYPLEVSWRGRVLAQSQASPRVSLPAGRQSLSLAAPAVFLRATLNVDVKGGGESAVEAPGLGRISIKANPDNCRVFIDGAFVDYPPILDRKLAAGTHVVSFRWEDGARSEESVAVPVGGIAFVTGRRD